MARTAQPDMIADKAALARAGRIVRERLASDATVYRVPSERAEIFAIADFLSPAECDHLIVEIDRVARPSSLFETDYASGSRTSYSGDLDREDSFVRMVERRMSDLVGLEMAWGEAMQGQRYMPGQEFKAHFDWFDTTARYWKTERTRGGQRCWTAMVFLNDVDEGGETAFPRLDISIVPQQGALLMWNNALPDGEPNRDVLHAGTPVIRGVKYVITKWFRTRRWS